MLACLLLALSLFFVLVVHAQGDATDETFAVDLGKDARFNPPEAWSSASTADVPCGFAGVAYSTTTVGASVEFNFTGALCVYNRWFDWSHHESML